MDCAGGHWEGKEHWPRQGSRLHKGRESKEPEQPIPGFPRKEPFRIVSNPFGLVKLSLKEKRSIVGTYGCIVSIQSKS